MMRFLYDLGFLTFGLISLPHFLKRMKQADDRGRLVRERFGIFSDQTRAEFQTNRPVWIHCVSVGEVLAVEKFMELFRSRQPDQKIVLTTVTPTGQKIAKKWEDHHLKVFYFPFDVRFAVSRFFQTFNPRALLLIETEIWPNVIEEAHQRKIPVGIINGRLSERSFRSFQRFKVFFSSVFSRIDFFLLQTEKDRGRWEGLGVNPDRVKVTGNMKLDLFKLNGQWEKDRTVIRQKWGFGATEKILVAGSTHPGEEEMLLKAYRQLRDEGISLRLVLAPRHIERSKKILEQVNKSGFEGHFMSKEETSSGSVPEVLILDKLGELRRFYAAADVVFVGGSLIRHGGQNPIEPAACRRAIVHGSWIFNFEELYTKLDQEKASVAVKGEKELVSALKRLLSNEKENEMMGTRAFEILKGLQGASERNLNWIGERYDISKKLFSSVC